MKINVSEGERPISEIETRDYPTITLDEADIRERSGMGGGPTIAKIRVDNEEGLGAYFWVSVTFHNGRPTVTVSTEPSKDKEKTVRKSVTGTCNRP